MRIINVLEQNNGIPISIESFPLYEEQLPDDVVKSSELFFIAKINKHISPNVLSYEEQEEHIDNGYYHNKNGYSIHIIWSYIEQ